MHMPFTFIHTADWQLGAEFGTMGETGPRLKAERFEAIDRVAAAAKDAHASHVLVAGDVFDAVKPPTLLVRQMLQRLCKHPRVTWHLLPGNHDPVQPGSVWEDVAREIARANATHVRLHLKPEPAEIAPGVQVLPAPLTARALAHDPTAWFDQAITPAGALRIGFAHGSVRGFSSEGEAAIPIAIDRAAKARLDYLALGDWHGAVKIDPRTWYSGTHETDRHRDNQSGFVLAVTLGAPGSAPEIKPIATGAFQWRQHALEVSSTADVDVFTAALKTEALPSDKLVLKLALSGRVPIGETAALDAALETLQASVAHLALERNGLRLATTADDLEALGTGTVAAVAAQLAEQERSGEARQQEIARRALQWLARTAGAGTEAAS